MWRRVSRYIGNSIVEEFAATISTVAEVNPS